MSRDEILSFAARHTAAGKKIILPCLRSYQPGHVIRRWTICDKEGDEFVEDQPLVVVREASFEEFAENYPAEFGEPRKARGADPRRFYEVTCE
jgi:hypothetical protein